jgi:hypothetical protein
MTELVFSLYGAFPRDRAAFVADTLYTLRELGLQYNRPPSRGRTVHQTDPQGPALPFEEPLSSAASPDRFPDAVDRVKGGFWPHVWMQAAVPWQEGRRGTSGTRPVPVVVSLRELPQRDSPARHEGSAFYEVSMAAPVSGLLDVEREEEGEQGLEWVLTQFFIPLFISRGALYGKVDFDPSGAREVKPYHLEHVTLPDLYLFNLLGAPFVRKYGERALRALPTNPPSLQRRWMARTPEGAVLFRCRVEADRWDGAGEMPVDFHAWGGRFALIEGLERAARDGRAHGGYS